MNPADLLYAAETEILSDIARLLRGGAVASADWKIEKLRKLGALNDRAAAILRRYRDAIQAGAMSEVDEAAMDALLRGEATFRRAKAAGATLADALPLDADPAIRATIETWQKNAVNQMNLAMATMLEQSGPLYVQTINRVTAEVLTGSMSGHEALVRAVREWSASGVPSIVDKAGRQWTSEAYANMVIRSNTRKVTTEVQMERAKEYGADLIEVSAHAGARPLCAPYQGRIYSLSGTSEKYPAFSSTSYGEPAGLFGINCVLGDTLVSGPGKCTAYRRKYSGEIIVIRTSGGHELSVTPNHPILTENGWIAAGLLEKGDKVVSSASLDRVNGTSPNPNHDVARIEDVFNSLIESGNVLRLPASSGYFHGDISDSEVDVVFPNSLLRDGVKAPVLKHRAKDPLRLAPKSADSLAGIGALDQVAFGSDHAPDSIMGGGGVSRSPIGACPSLGDAGSLGPVGSERDAELCEVLSDSGLGDSNLGRDFVLPHAGIVHGKEVGSTNTRLSLQEAFPIVDGNVHPAPLEAVDNSVQRTAVLVHDCPGLDPGSVELDDIVFVERKPAQSPFVHVYNLQTKLGWFYANGIVTHNCGHVQYPFFEGISRQTYSPDETEAEKAENARVYQESQKQRAIERGIRAAKREAAVFESLGERDAFAQAKALISDRQAAMRDFIKETGRTRQRGREQVYD